MYFFIQELDTKREIKGSSKEIFLGTKNIDGVVFNTYEFGRERFIRPIKKAYRITLHESYRENGKVKKNQYVLATLNYYQIAESYEDVLWDFDGLWYRLLRKLDEIIEKLNLPESVDLQEFTEELQDAMTEKLEPLFNKIYKEFKRTEECQVFLKHKKIVQDYKDAKDAFARDYDVLRYEYDICYDLYGNLTNETYLEKIKRRSDYRRGEKSNYNNYRGAGNVSYTEEQKRILKQFYRVLGKSFHPDSNVGKDTSEQMKFLNKLKEDWGL